MPYNVTSDVQTAYNTFKQYRHGFAVLPYGIRAFVMRNNRILQNAHKLGSGETFRGVPVRRELAEPVVDVNQLGVLRVGRDDGVTFRRPNRI